MSETAEVYIAISSPYHDNDTILGVYDNQAAAIRRAEAHLGTDDAERVDVQRWLIGLTGPVQTWSKYIRPDERLIDNWPT